MAYRALLIISKMEIFDLYFATLVGWQYHPGNRRDGVYLSIDECAEISLEMMKKREQLKEKIECLSLLD